MHENFDNLLTVYRLINAGGSPRKWLKLRKRITIVMVFGGLCMMSGVGINFVVVSTVYIDVIEEFYVAALFFYLFFIAGTATLSMVTNATVCAKRKPLVERKRTTNIIPGRITIREKSDMSHSVPAERIAIQRQA